MLFHTAAELAMEKQDPRSAEKLEQIAEQFKDLKVQDLNDQHIEEITNYRGGGEGHHYRQCIYECFKDADRQGLGRGLVQVETCLDQCRFLTDDLSANTSAPSTSNSTTLGGQSRTA